MKKPVIIFVLIAVVVVLGVGAYSLSQNSSQSDSMTKKDEPMLPKEDAGMEKTEDPMMKAETVMDDNMSTSGYVQYSKAALDEAASNRRVLFFYASWCPTCKPADERFSQNTSKIPEDVTVIRVNYNDPETDQEEKDLARKYGVTYQHTFVQIDSSGKEVTKWNGGQIDELLSNSK